MNGVCEKMIAGSAMEDWGLPTRCLTEWVAYRRWDHGSWERRRAGTGHCEDQSGNAGRHDRVTRSRGSVFMNQFREPGFICYDDRLRVHRSLLTIVRTTNVPYDP